MDIESKIFIKDSNEDHHTMNEDDEQEITETAAEEYDGELINYEHGGTINFYYYAENFEELLSQLPHQLHCGFCMDVKFEDPDFVKAHIRSKHYQFAVFVMIEDKQVCVIPCRLDCEVQRTSLAEKARNRSHFHCPVCHRVYGRSATMKHHLLVSHKTCPRHANARLLDTKVVLEREDGNILHKYNSGDSTKITMNGVSLAESAITQQSDFDDSQNESLPFHENESPERSNLTVELFQNESSSKQKNDTTIRRSLLPSGKRKGTNTQARIHALKKKRENSSLPYLNQEIPTTPSDAFGILKLMAPTVDAEDQLFAASLAAEMRNLSRKKKLTFKIKVLNYLHEALFEEED